jgi:hypothetical protein
VKATIELQSGASKENKIGCENAQRNTNKEKVVSTEQEQESIPSPKIEYPS